MVHRHISLCQELNYTCNRKRLHINTIQNYIQNEKPRKSWLKHTVDCKLYHLITTNSHLFLSNINANIPESGSELRSPHKRSWMEFGSILCPDRDLCCESSTIWVIICLISLINIIVWRRERNGFYKHVCIYQTLSIKLLTELNFTN